MRLILLGAPGSGKGTAALKLASRFGIENVVASTLLRNVYESGSPDGSKIKEFMDSGNLVPDEIVNRILLDYLKSLNGYVLDGYPRTKIQAEKLEEKLVENGVSIDRVIYLDVSLDVSLERNMARMTCPSCGYSPSSGVTVCPECGTHLVKRADDQIETIRHRFKTYLDLTEPLIDYYEKKGILLRIDASASIDEVEKLIIGGLCV